MKRWARWTTIGIATAIGLAAAAVGSGVLLARQKLHRQVPVEVGALAVPAGVAAIERGRYLYASRGCADCHGSRGGGRLFIDNDGGFRAAGPHISPGAGSVTAGYGESDWVRTVRHGVKPNGQPVFIMPSEDYTRWSDADMGALIAYARQMPPASGGAAVLELPLLVRLLYGFGAIQDAAQKIDHRLPPQPPVADGPTVENGRYVAQMCGGCHGSGFSGGKIPGGPPQWPAAANLTPGAGSAMPRYADAAAFIRMMKSGKRADGSAIQVMPFESLAQLSESDLQGLHRYLLTLQPRDAGGR